MRARPTKLGESNRVFVLLSILGFLVGAYCALEGRHTELLLISISGLGLVQLEESKRRGVGDRVRDALNRAHIPLKEAAAIMKMDQGDLTRALNGEMKLDLYRLEMLPDEFHQEWWPLQAHAKGVPELFKTWLKVLPVLVAVEDEGRPA